jgi:benzoyl-CoA reductase subunit B
MAEKQLQSTVRAAEYQKAWFADLRREVFEKQKPYALVQADMPLELFQVLDIPVVSNQWWASLVAAKRLAPSYLDGLNALGYHDGLCRYCSLSLASTIAGDPAQAPWGGLPKPALVSARLTCDCIQRVFEIWAERLGSPFFPLDAPGASELPPRWWELSRHRWEQCCTSLTGWISWSLSFASRRIAEPKHRGSENCHPGESGDPSGPSERFGELGSQKERR